MAANSETKHFNNTIDEKLSPGSKQGEIAPDDFGVEITAEKEEVLEDQAANTKEKKSGKKDFKAEKEEVSEDQVSNTKQGEIAADDFGVEITAEKEEVLEDQAANTKEKKSGKRDLKEALAVVATVLDSAIADVAKAATAVIDMGERSKSEEQTQELVRKNDGMRTGDLPVSVAKEIVRDIVPNREKAPEIATDEAHQTSPLTQIAQLLVDEDALNNSRIELEGQLAKDQLSLANQRSGVAMRDIAADKYDDTKDDHERQSEGSPSVAIMSMVVDDVDELSQVLRDVGGNIQSRVENLSDGEHVVAPAGSPQEISRGGDIGPAGSPQEISRGGDIGRG